MFDVLHDQARPDLSLDEVNRTLAHDGIFVCVDVNMRTNVVDNINDPKAAMIYAISLLHCMPISLNEKDGMGLGAAWGRERAVTLMGEHGMHNISVDSRDQLNNVYVWHKKFTDCHDVN